MKQILLSKLKSATVFNVDRLTIYSWLRKGCPVVDSGGPGKPAQLDFQAVLQWRLEDLESMGIEEGSRALAATQARQRLKVLKKGDRHGTRH